MKKALVVSLVVLLVMIGFPVLMPGMGMPFCPDCGPAVAGDPLCLLAVIAGVAMLLAARSGRIRVGWERHRDLLRAALFDRPPQLAAIV